MPPSDGDEHAGVVTAPAHGPGIRDDGGHRNGDAAGADQRTADSWQASILRILVTPVEDTPGDLGHLQQQLQQAVLLSQRQPAARASVLPLRLQAILAEAASASELQHAVADLVQHFAVPLFLACSNCSARRLCLWEADLPVPGRFACGHACCVFAQRQCKPDGWDEDEEWRALFPMELLHAASATAAAAPPHGAPEAPDATAAEGRHALRANGQAHTHHSTGESPPQQHQPQRPQFSGGRGSSGRSVASGGRSDSQASMLETVKVQSGGAADPAGAGPARRAALPAKRPALALSEEEATSPGGMRYRDGWDAGRPPSKAARREVATAEVHAEGEEEGGSGLWGPQGAASAARAAAKPAAARPRASAGGDSPLAQQAAQRQQQAPWPRRQHSAEGFDQQVDEGGHGHGHGEDPSGGYPGNYQPRGRPPLPPQATRGYHAAPPGGRHSNDGSRSFHSDSQPSRGTGSPRHRGGEAAAGAAYTYSREPSAGYAPPAGRDTQWLQQPQGEGSHGRSSGERPRRAHDDALEQDTAAAGPAGACQRQQQQQQQHLSAAATVALLLQQQQRSLMQAATAAGQGLLMAPAQALELSDVQELLIAQQHQQQSMLPMAQQLVLVQGPQGITLQLAPAAASLDALGGGLSLQLGARTASPSLELAMAGNRMLGAVAQHSGSRANSGGSSRRTDRLPEAVRLGVGLEEEGEDEEVAPHPDNLKLRTGSAMQLAGQLLALRAAPPAARPALQPATRGGRGQARGRGGYARPGPARGGYGGPWMQDAGNGADDEDVGYGDQGGTDYCDEEDEYEQWQQQRRQQQQPPRQQQPLRPPPPQYDNDLMDGRQQRPFGGSLGHPGRAYGQYDAGVMDRRLSARASPAPQPLARAPASAVQPHGPQRQAARPGAVRPYGTAAQRSGGAAGGSRGKGHGARPGAARAYGTGAKRPLGDSDPSFMPASALVTGTGRARSYNRTVPSFADIVRHGLLSPGRIAFAVGNIKEEVDVEITRAGDIVHEGAAYPSISAFALAVLRSRNSDRQACDGWKEVRLNGVKMDVTRKQCLQRMFELGEL